MLNYGFHTVIHHKGTSMDKDASVTQAKAVPLELIKHQPNLFSLDGGTLIHNPETVADFCSGFIKTFSKSLVEISKS